MAVFNRVSGYVCTHMKGDDIFLINVFIAIAVLILFTIVWSWLLYVIDIFVGIMIISITGGFLWWGILGYLAMCIEHA